MKRWVYISFISLFFACEEQEIIFEGPYHVRFTETTSTYKESFSEEIDISVHMVGPQRTDTDINIGYSISGNAREGIDYEILGNRGEVRIPRGQSFGYIRIKLINNSNNILESHDMVLTLQTIDPSDLDIGFGPGVKIGSTYTMTIEDDCILGGTYTGTNDPSQPPVENIRIFSQDCINYILSTYDVHIFTFPEDRPLVFQDNGDNTVTIPQQEDPTLVPDQATIRGSGVVDPITREIILNIEMVDFEGSPVFTVTLTPR